MLTFALISLGITYGITTSALLASLRVAVVDLTGHSLWVATLIYCPACTNFWVGAALGAGGLWPEPVSGFDAIWRAAFAAAALGALWSEYGPRTLFDIEQPQFTTTEPTP
jgi:hypothetical protein